MMSADLVSTRVAATTGVHSGQPIIRAEPAPRFRISLAGMAA
jgi:hypothetical protein